MDTVCIPKWRYEYLAKCERLVDLEFEEKFSKNFIADVVESEKAYARGDCVAVKTKKERKKLFDSL